ncbi:MAG: hypothetical protein M3Q91_18865 [Acidobacteriota bacterium]|nr:hypothetical protein [Acidobacteriota bacterium]
MKAMPSRVSFSDLFGGGIPSPGTRQRFQASAAHIGLHYHVQHHVIHLLT